MSSKSPLVEALTPAALAWEPGPAGPGHQVLRGAGYFISYNPMPPLGGPETALQQKDGNKRLPYLILNGDHRAAYLKAANEGGYEACLRYYESKKAECRSGWSEDDDEAEDEAEEEEGDD